MNYIIKKIESSETLALRHSVLRSHGPIEECIYPGDDDEKNFHLAVFYENEIEAIASFFLDNDPELGTKKMYRLRGMASSPKIRGQGFGKKLIHHAVKELKILKTDILWCNAREVAFGFYQNLGFSTYSDFFDIPGIGPHKKMKLNL